MIRVHLLSAAAALALVPAALLAQASPGANVPTGMPGANPYVSPDGVDSRAGRTMISAADQFAIDSKAAEARAAQQAHGGRAIPARPSDIFAQAAVNDTFGLPVGTIESVDADGAIVVTSLGKVKVPLNAFGKNKNGLLIGMSKKDFEALVAKANATPAG